MSDISSIKVYEKEFPSETSRIKFYCILFKEIKVNLGNFVSSFEVDMQNLEALISPMIVSADNLIKEINSVERIDSVLKQSTIEFSRMFLSFKTFLIQNFATFKAKILSQLNDQSLIVDEISNYFLALSSVSFKDFSFIRNKLKSSSQKKQKHEADLNSLIEKYKETNLDKIIPALSDFLDFTESYVKIKDNKNRSKLFLDYALKNFLLNAANAYLILSQNIQKITDEISLFKKEYFENCLEKVKETMNSVQSMQISMEDIEISYHALKNTKILLPKDVKEFFSKSPGGESVLASVETTSEVLAFRKQYFRIVYKFIESIFSTMENFFEKANMNLFVFKPIRKENCPLKSYMDFLFQITNLQHKKVEELKNSNNLLVPSLNGILKDLATDEGALADIIEKLKERMEELKEANKKGNAKNSSELIDEGYNNFNLYIGSFETEYTQFYKKYSEEAKVLDSFKQSSIDNIIKQLDKSFTFLVEFISVIKTDLYSSNFFFSETKEIFTKEFGKEDKIIEDIFNIISLEELDLRVLDKYSLFAPENLPNEDASFSYEQLLGEEKTKIVKEKLAEFDKSKKAKPKKDYSEELTSIFPPIKLNEKETITKKCFANCINANCIFILGNLIITDQRVFFSSLYKKTLITYEINALQIAREESIIKISDDEKENIFAQEKELEAGISELLHKPPPEVSAAEETHEEEMYNIEKTPKALNELIKKITKKNFGSISENQLHKGFTKHFIVDQPLESADQTIQIPIYMIFQILYKPEFSLNVNGFEGNFVLFLQSLRKDYDNVFTKTDFSEESIPKFYTREYEKTYKAMASGISEEFISNMIDECKLYPIKQQYNYTYHHPVPNPVFMGPKLIKIDDTYSFFFISPSCFIVEIKSLCSEFMLLDTFYTVSQYKFEAEFSDDMKVCKTKLNAFFKIEIVKEVWMTKYVVKNGYSENDTYINQFLYPNMIKELQRKAEELNKPFTSRSYESNENEVLINSDEVFIVNEEGKASSSSQQKVLQSHPPPAEKPQERKENAKKSSLHGYRRLSFLFIGALFLLSSISFSNEKINYIIVNCLLFMILLELIFISEKVENI